LCASGSEREIEKNLTTQFDNSLYGFHAIFFPLSSSSKVNRFRLDQGDYRKSSGQTPFTIKPKQLALKKPIFNPPKILPKLKKKIKQLLSPDPTMLKKI
jgi:hypothetical protein